jgi:ATP-binding cassette subfamily B protein
MRRRLLVIRHVARLTISANPRVAALIAVIVVVQAASVGVVALVQRWLVDDAGRGVTTGLVGTAVLGAVAHAGYAAGNRIQNNLRVDLGERVDLLLSREVYTLAAGVPGVEHLERPDYLDRLQVLRRGAASLAGSCWSAATLVTSVASLSLSLWLLAAVHPALILLALLGVPPLVAAARGQGLVRAVVDANAGRLRRERELHELCVTSQPAQEVRIADSWRRLSRMADDLQSEVTRREDRVRIRAAALELAGWLCFGAGFAAAMLLVARQATTGAATLGDVVLVISLATRLRDQIAMTVFSVNDVGQAGNVATHYLWLRDYVQARPGGGESAPPRLRRGLALDRVRFRYPGTSTDVLRDVTLTLRSGSTVALVGVNGAGKTTLIKLLAGLYEPTAGAIRVDGQDLSTVDRRRWYAANSAVFQDFAKFELTVRETVGVGDLDRLPHRPAVAAALDRGGAVETVCALPDGVETQLGRAFGGVELSQGQWQRLALARGLMREQPLLLVLDEPSAALDPQAEHDLFERFVAVSRAAAARNGAVTLLVSHRFSTVRMADHIVVIGDGTVIEEGGHAELMARDGQYAALYRLQSEGYRS